MHDSILVIGTGITGMRTAAELVQQGFKVHLVDKRSRIDNIVKESEDLFPSVECAACSLQPLLLELLNNPNVILHMETKLLSLQGQAGNFIAKTRYIQPQDSGSSQESEIVIGAVILAMEPGQENIAIPVQEGIFILDANKESSGIGAAVIQACAAASSTAAFLTSLGKSRDFETKEKKAFSIQSDEKPNILVVIDSDEGKIAEALDLDELVLYTQSLPGVVKVAVTPNAAEGSKIKELINSVSFNRLVVAGPSPIPYEGLFQSYMEEAGFNPFLLEMVNLHNQCARVHINEKKHTTDKAKILTKMGVARSRMLEPLEKLSANILSSCLLTGGNASGVSCAVRLAEMGIPVHLVASSQALEEVRNSEHPQLRTLSAKLSQNEKIILHPSAEIEDSEGCLGNFKVKLTQSGRSETIEVGAIVISSGESIIKNVDGSPFEESLALEKDSNGYYISTQGILNLLDFTTEGVFNCGTARSALETEDAILDGEAAASRAGCILASNLLDRSPVISCVLHENCDGCAYCIDPCPTRTLTLLEYMYQGSVKKIAEVNPVTCIGCGICMSTCPKKGIYVKHYKLETFSEMVKAALSEDDFSPSIISFCCNRCAYPGADNAGNIGIDYPASVKIIRSVCSGMIHPNIIIDALTQEGADGVLLCGCHPGNCRSHNGITKSQARAEAIELMLEDLALEPERFRLELIAASEGHKFAEVVKEMTEELTALGPNPFK